MGSTTKKALRWPTPTVGVKPNVAQDIRNLAEDVDAALGTSTFLANGTDLNTLMTGGYYTGGAFINAPENYAGGFSILVIGTLTLRYGGQIAIRNDAGNPIWYYRSLVSATWSAWSKIQPQTDTGWLLSPIAAASGWGTKTDPKGNTSGTLVGGVRNLNGFVEYRFQLTRTGAAITASASGNIGGDPVIATVSPNAWPNLVPSSIVDDAFDIVGVQAGVARIDETGAITISALYPNDAINTNDVIQVSLRFLAG